MNNSRKLCGLAVLAVTAGAASLGASAAEHDASGLTSAWWQWAISIPAQESPLLDVDGQRCMVGQRGQTWFLAGNFGGSASRACSVPTGTKIFFPVVNYIAFDSPGVCGQVGSLSVPELRGFSAAFIDSVTRVSVSLDGAPLRSVRRIRSEVFPLALPAENIFTSPPSCIVPAGVFPRAVDDGYYAEIENLSVGEHSVQFTASAPGGFDLNVVYRLIVVPRD
jgi:hypothetical protein